MVDLCDLHEEEFVLGASLLAKRAKRVTEIMRWIHYGSSYNHNTAAHKHLFRSHTPTS